MKGRGEEGGGEGRKEGGRREMCVCVCARVCVCVCV